MNISITRALKDLKTLDARLSKAIADLSPVDITCGKHKGIALKSNMPIEEFEKAQAAQFQKVKDLINNRVQVKTQIALSNSETFVKVAGVKMTVAQAIEEKNFLSTRKHLLQVLRRANEAINSEMEKSRSTLDNQLLNLIQANTGKDKRVDATDFDKIAKPFLDANTLKKLDPLKIDELISSYEEYIENFEADIDIVLSESNSKTEIVVDL